MTQSKGPLTTSFWFQVHISYRFGGDSRTKLQKGPSRTYGRTSDGGVLAFIEIDIYIVCFSNQDKHYISHVSTFLGVLLYHMLVPGNQ